MSAFPPLSTLPAGLHGVVGWDGARPAAAGARGGAQGDAAQAFGFTGNDQAARVLSVPPGRGDSAAQLESRFLSCLFERA